MTRWQVLWRAIVKWWKNEPPPAPPLPPPPRADGPVAAHQRMVEYGELYTKRVGIPFPQYTAQAAAIVRGMDVQRAPTLESEVRVLAIAVVQLLGHLKDEADRQVVIQELLLKLVERYYGDE